MPPDRDWALDIAAETVVWLDREGRNESGIQISEAIREALLDAGASAESVHILVNDRTAENVILADQPLIREEFANDAYMYSTEGQNGKSALRSMYQQAQQHYREMQHGVRLLKKVQLANSAACSPAVQTFLNTFDRECWWIRRPNGNAGACV